MSRKTPLRTPPSPLQSWILYSPTPEPGVGLPPTTPLNVNVPDSPFSSSGDPSFTSQTDSFGIPPTPSSMNSFMAGSPDSLPDEEADQVFFPDALLAAGLEEQSNTTNMELPDLGNLDDLSSLVKEDLKKSIQKRRRESGLAVIELTSQDCQIKKPEPRETKISQMDEDRRLRRRASNRRAAAKSRKKKKVAASGLVNEVGRLEDENDELKQIINGLEGDYKKLEQYLQDHMEVCPLAKEPCLKTSPHFSSSPPPLPTPPHLPSPVILDQQLPQDILDVILQCDH